MIREDALPKGCRARRQFTSVGGVRREMVALYWQAKGGEADLDPRVLPTMAKLLDMIARSMVKDEVEIRAVALEGKMLELAKLLQEQGKEVPDWALAGLERKLPN